MVEIHKFTSANIIMYTYMCIVLLKTVDVIIIQLLIICSVSLTGSVPSQPPTNLLYNFTAAKVGEYFSFAVQR